MACLYILAGPTAIGKTALAIQWAKARGAHILSADSTLFYKGMDIGTAKPTLQEREGVPHHGIDIISIKESFSIKTYLELAKAVIDEVIKQKKKPLLITGGSGLYLKAFLSPVVDDIEISKEVQQRLDELWAEKGLAGWVNALQEASKEGLGKLDIHNPRRVQKALGRVWMTKKSIPELEKMWEDAPAAFPDFEKRVVCLMRADEILKERIKQRAEQMLEQGLVKEVEELLKQGLSENPVAAAAIGYRETIAYLKGEITSLEELKAKIISNTTSLVKKQKTFFRHQISFNKIVDLGKEEGGALLERLFD